MDFSKAVVESDKDKRDDLIGEELNRETWENHLSDEMRYGGWPEDASVDDFTVIDEGDDWLVRVKIDFIESVASGCKDINHEHIGSADFEITINKQTGLHQFGDSPEISINSDPFDGDDDDEQDVFPDDYL